jgi:outer membrane protein assembly factor BamE (lipoprotein component of BamABCDE complex)
MPIRIFKSPWPFVALLACVGASSCSGTIPGMYRIPIQQGNVITVEMLQELKLGMDKRKVSFILGTPLVTDAFHLDRWDYYYSYETGSGERDQQTASLFFEGDRLARIEANIDSKIDFHTVTKATDNVLIVPPKKKGGFLAAITPAFLERDEEQSRQDAIAKSLSSGVNEDQPGTGETESSGEVLDPALEGSAPILPGFDGGVAPSEVYAPNASGEVEAASAPQMTSAETERQSRYLEDLFQDFGAAPAPTAATEESADTTPAAPESSILVRPTRD